MLYITNYTQQWQITNKVLILKHYTVTERNTEHSFHSLHFAGECTSSKSYFIWAPRSIQFHLRQTAQASVQSPLTSDHSRRHTKHNSGLRGVHSIIHRESWGRGIKHFTTTTLNFPVTFDYLIGKSWLFWHIVTFVITAPYKYSYLLTSWSVSCWQLSMAVLWNNLQTTWWEKFYYKA